MSTPTESQKIADLRAFLVRRPRTPDETHAPAIPPELGGLPGQVYLDLAVEYIHSYPFARTFTPKGRKRSTIHPHSDWQAKARAYLTACVNVDRGGLAAIAADPDPAPYDAERAQQHFVHTVVFRRRWALEEVAAEVLALVQLFRSEASSAATPMTTTGEPRDSDRSGREDVLSLVRARDLKCRMTGVSPEQNTYTAEGQQQVFDGDAAYGPVHVAHGLPLGIRQAAFELVTALTGVQCGCTADCVENALMLHEGVHRLFGSWKLYLEWTDGQVMIRARPDPASPFCSLASIGNDRGQLCHRPGALVDQPLRRRHDDSIADVDPKFFVLHKFIGDIVWMAGGAEPISDDEQDEEDAYEGMCVTEDNIDGLIDRLNAPEMDLVPRERAGMFGVRIELVPKNAVWRDS